MDYAEGNRNNFVHQLACNLNRKGISYAEALGFILSDYNYNEIEVMNAVKSAYNNTHEFGTDKEYKTPKTMEKTNPKSSSTNEEEIDDDEEKPAAIERLEMFLNKCGIGIPLHHNRMTKQIHQKLFIAVYAK